VFGGKGKFFFFPPLFAPPPRFLGPPLGPPAADVAAVRVTMRTVRR